MKRLLVNNIAIQFSCFEHENNMEAVSELLDSVNNILREEFPDIDIKIIVSDMFSPVDIDELDPPRRDETAEPDRFWHDGE